DLTEWITRGDFAIAEISGLRTMSETKQPLIIPDVANHPGWTDMAETHWIGSYAGAPILRDGEVIGFLNLDSDVPGFFRPEQADRLQTFADQAAIALRNAQLFAAEHDQRALAEALRDTAAAINSTLNSDEVMDRILENVGEVAAYDSASIMMIEEDTAQVVRYHLKKEDFEPRWPFEARLSMSGTTNLRHMQQTGQPKVISNTEDDADWVSVPGAEWIRSQAAAPIRLEGRVAGFLTLDSATPHFFSEETADRLQAFADQAAIAIQNARLYDAVQSYAHNLEQRVRERTAEVEAQRAQLQAILDAMGEGVVYSIGTRIVYTNRALAELLGFETEDTAETADYLLNRVLSDSELLQKWTTEVRKAFNQRLSWRGETRLHRRDGIEFDAALTITQVPGDDEPGAPGVVAIYRDISQDKALQAQKDRFIANASHELRTPLANIKTRLYLIKRQPDKLPSHLEVLGRVTDNMAELIENLLDVSRFERGVIPLYRQPVRLQDMIGEVVAIQQAEAERKAITLTAHLADAPLTVLADSQRITQVITNLIVNAINYTPEGGQVTVELESTPEGQAAIHVRDTGPGIPPDLTSQVFEPFFRANEGAISGTGLGLTIAKEIVTLHGGEIFADNNPDGGSVFTILLDLTEEE
ncbi:MAG: GAF domain-containing protein, partial [Anaerolineae bacterium]|nr:GAF domain-containing protein [Anaerolineae bacterium]